ncbi:MAG: hypothetical protein ACOYWZ_08755 [Bacillota bacterium]
MVNLTFQAGKQENLKGLIEKLNIPPKASYIISASLGMITMASNTTFLSYQAGKGIFNVWIGTSSANKGTTTMKTLAFPYSVLPAEPYQIDIASSKEVLKVGENIEIKASIKDKWNNPIYTSLKWLLNGVEKDELPTTSLAADNWQIQTKYETITSNFIKIAWLGKPYKIIGTKEGKEYVGERMYFEAQIVDEAGHILPDKGNWKWGTSTRLIGIEDNILCIENILFGTVSIQYQCGELNKEYSYYIQLLEDMPRKATYKILDIDFKRFVIIAEISINDLVLKEEIPFLPEYVDLLNDPNKVDEVNEWMKLRVLRRAREIEKELSAKKATQQLLNK